MEAECRSIRRSRWTTGSSGGSPTTSACWHSGTTKCSCFLTTDIVPCPPDVVATLMQEVGVKGMSVEAESHQNERPAPDGASDEVLRRALALYDRLLIHEMSLGA